MKKLFLITSMLALLAPVFAQSSKERSRDKKEERRDRINAIVKQEEEGVITYTKHVAFGAKLNTDGYGAFVEIGRARSLRKAMLFQLEISERKHPKEFKFFDPNVTIEPIFYGKINYFYPVKLGVQQQFLLGNKGNKNGVSISGNIGGGVSLGLLRPYLLQVRKNGTDTYVGYDSPDSTLFLTGPYYAAPNVGTGWNKLKVVPGLYIKPALRFDYGKYNEMITAIEVGITAEYYTKEIAQIVYNKPDKFFFGAFVSVMFGKRK